MLFSYLPRKRTYSDCQTECLSIHTSPPFLNFRSSNVSALNRIVSVNKPAKASVCSIITATHRHRRFYQASLWQQQQKALKLAAQRGKQRGKQNYYTSPAVSEPTLPVHCGRCCADRHVHTFVGAGLRVLSPQRALPRTL